MSVTKATYRYSSVLRIGENVLYSSTQRESLWNMLEKYKGAFDEVIFFTQMNHSVRSLATHRKTAELMCPMLRHVEALGLRSGIDVLCTMGFFADDVDCNMESYSPYININGDKVTGRLCPSESKNIAYFMEQYRIYAAIAPTMIYIDDDISSASCFCDDCICRFAREYDLGESDRLGLIELFNNEDISVRKISREAWIHYNSIRIGEIFGHIEKAVHSVNLNIELGFMSHMCGIDGLDTDNWAMRLRSESCEKISWRPGGGVYTEFTPFEVINKANRIGAQIRYLPSFAARVESEIENFPYQSLKKSPSFTMFESLIYLAVGCTGTAFNICSSIAPDYIEHEGFFKAALDVSEAGKLIVDTFGRSQPEGIGFAWDKLSASDLAVKNWNLSTDVPFAHNLSHIGLPTAYDSAHTSVFFLNESLALQLSDDALTDILKAGVLMDAAALDVCNKRGFGSYTGFKIAHSYSADTMERDTEHFINLPGKRVRDVRQAFGWCGIVYTLQKTAENAEYLTEIIDFKQEPKGFGSGIFENPYGGRVAVEGMLAFDWCFSLHRSIHMKNLCRWLSKDTIGAYLKSFHRMALWLRSDGIFLANISAEQAIGAELAVLGNAAELEAIVFRNGNMERWLKINKTAQDGKYAIYRLPEIPSIGSLLIKTE